MITMVTDSRHEAYQRKEISSKGGIKVKIQINKVFMCKKEGNFQKEFS